ncbi:MAG: hypothetical protein ABJE95_28680 [Byssovorax sp.]
MTEPQITALGPAFATGRWNALFLGVWRGAASVHVVQEWGRQYESMAARCPGGFAALWLIEAQAPPPDAEARRAFKQGSERLGSSIRGIATVAEASGFAGAAIRSVMTALSNATSKRLDRRMFSSCRDASVWLSPYLHTTSGHFHSSLEIASAVETFRSMIDPRTAPAEIARSSVRPSLHSTPPISAR